MWWCVLRMRTTSAVFRLLPLSRRCFQSSVKLAELIGKGKFGPVCQPWQSVSVEEQQISMLYPLLMLPGTEKEDEGGDESDDSRDICGFYSLSTQKVYQLKLPEARDKRCLSSKDWLITLGLDLEIHFLNPFAGVRIRLPILGRVPFERDYRSVIRKNFIQKMVLSSRPDDKKNCVVMVISDPNEFAFLRLGDEVWTENKLEGINDVIYFNGQFYAIDEYGRLFIVDISSPQPKTIEFADVREVMDKDYWENENCPCDFYLVEGSSVGELFIVAREMHVLWGTNFFLRLVTDGFQVYKLDLNNRKLTEVKSLDNRALFVGSNSSFTIFPSDQHPGCESNCIYFTDARIDNRLCGAGHDMGLFRMETQEIVSHYVGPNFISRFAPPLWIFPSTSM